MRLLCQLVLVFALALATAFASPPADGDSPSGKALPAVPSAPRTEARGRENTTPTPDLELEINELRDLLAGQSRQLQVQSDQLQRQQKAIDLLAERLHAMNEPRDRDVSAVAVVDSARSVPVAAAITQSAPSQAQPAAQSQTDVLRRIEERLAQIGPFSFSGDLRLRDESFFGGPANQSLVRHRGRLRTRFYINARLNNEISGGLALASGHIEDAISTNQDLDQFYTRKPVALDRAFITYTPQWFRPLTLTGGRFAVPWYRTELTWDNDINVEGVAQTLNFSFPDSPVLKRVAVVAFALPFAQTTGVNFNFRPGDNDRSTRQSVLYGGQLQTEWQIQSWLKFSAYSAFYNWHKADPMAFSVSVVNPASPNRGTLRLSGFSLQNSVTVWTQSTSVPTTAGGNTIVNTSIVNAQFGSKFGLLDTIARFDLKTASPRWPVVLIADFVQNTKACSNVGNFFGPIPVPGASITAITNVPCNPHDRQAYWLEGRVGRSTEQRDLQLAYTRMFIEREAVLGSVNFSDLRQNSNVSQHRVEVLYNAYRNVQLGFTGLFGRPLQARAPTETMLKRLQFDVLYRF